MARVNVGINPLFISDQHLLAESVEITMITGSLIYNEFTVRNIPVVFSLGKGHINFFKNKIIYLKKRLLDVNNELNNRGFKPTTFIDLNIFPDKYVNDWKPKDVNTYDVRQRIKERLLNPKNAGPDYHKYYRKPIEDLNDFIRKMELSELYYV